MFMIAFSLCGLATEKDFFFRRFPTSHHHRKTNSGQVRGSTAKKFCGLYPTPSTPKPLSSSGVAATTMIVR
jgi:hypothetical protein